MNDSIAAIMPRSRGERDQQPALDAAGASDARHPSTILHALERSVVGQRCAVEEISMLLSMHAHGMEGNATPNAILVGPTGVGKTHTLSVASTIIGVPFVATDATSLVPSGIVGEQVEDVIDALVEVADSMLASSGMVRRRDDDLRLAERGVIFVDEFDKLAVPDESRGSMQSERRVVQRRLLKLAEGARLRVGVKHREAASRDRFVDSTGMLLLAGGVFDGLRSSGRHATPADIVDAGFIPELIGRLPVLIGFGGLEIEDLVAILDHAEVSPLVSWRRYFATALDVGLHLDDMAKWLVAERASRLGMGARGLQHVLFPALAAKATEIFGSKGGGDVVLGASDFTSELQTIPLATPLH